MPTDSFPLLNSPIQLGRVVFRNRMFSAPSSAFLVAMGSALAGIVLSIFLVRLIRKTDD